MALDERELPHPVTENSTTNLKVQGRLLFFICPESRRAMHVTSVLWQVVANYRRRVYRVGASSLYTITGQMGFIRISRSEIYEWVYQ